MDDDSMPGELRLSAGLGPLPEADGTTEANKERCPEGGYTFDEIPAWSESLVLAYAAEQVAAERERCARVAEQQAECNGLAAGWHIAAEIRWPNA